MYIHSQLMIIDLMISAYSTINSFICCHYELKNMLFRKFSINFEMKIKIIINQCYKCFTVNTQINNKIVLKHTSEETL